MNFRDRILYVLYFVLMKLTFRSVWIEIRGSFWQSDIT